MYLVGHLTKAHGNEPPQWEVFALRLTRSKALADCRAEVDRFYIPIKFGRLPSSAQAVFPRRA